MQLSNTMKLSKIRSILLLYILSLSVFSCVRFVNYFIYHEYFKGSYNFIELISLSLKFDLMTASYLLLIPVLLIMLPLKGRLSSIIRGSGLHLGFGMIVFSILALIGDSIYFGVVNRHTFSDLPLLATEISFVIPFLINDYLALTISSLVIIISLIILWVKSYKWLLYSSIEEQSYKLQLGLFIITLPILLLFLRGMDFHGKSMGMIDAYKGQSERQANLVLNGIYTGAKGTAQSYNRANYTFFNDEQVEHLTNKNPEQAYQYPFLEKFSENKSNDRNIVIILVEALSYAYIDGLSGSNYKVTPFLDELTKKSEVYDRFYAAGQRSNLGVQAVLFGLPPLASVGYIGGGLELSRLTKIGQVAQQHGYQTQMLQSSKRDSIRLDSIANYAGFQQYLGLSDIPITRNDYPDPSGAHFGWDYEMLMKTLELANESTKPFISFSFTGTTHMPYVETPKHLQVYPYGQDTFTDFLNTIRYTDDALQTFFEKASKQPWYENTTFIILADHTLFNSSDPSLESAFHIPLWIYRPGQNIEPKRHTMLASQLDILPTVFDLLGFNDEFSAVGRSLYRDRLEYVPVVKGDLLGAFTDKGSFLSTDDSIIKGKGEQAFFDTEAVEVAEKLRLEFQLSQQAVLNNTWGK